MFCPIMVDQALFYIGDPHMAQGDGELSGTAIEASANVWLQLIVRKDVPLDSPVLETPSHWYTHGLIVRRPQQMLLRAQATSAHHLATSTPRCAWLPRRCWRF